MRISTSYFMQRGLDSILEQQKRLADIQEQIASGNRLNRPSDDPSASAQILRLEQAIATNEQYQRNADMAINRLTLEESTLKSAQDTLLRIREIAIQGNNSTMSDTDRNALAQEVDERLKELVGLANTRDANQEYLFAGYMVNTKPFSLAADGSYVYSGDNGQRGVQISTGRQILDSDAGNEVFMNLRNGNGTFQVNPAIGNTGASIIDVGQVLDRDSYNATLQNYTISFVTNSSGNIAYNVIGNVDGQIIPSPPQNAINDAPDYVIDAAISFNGIQTAISGTPVAGDVYTVSPSDNQDVFSTIQKLITALQLPTEDSNVNESEALNLMNQSLSELDIAFDKFTRVRTSVGARLNTTDAQVSVNEAYQIELTATLSGVRDLDITAAAVELQSRLIALEAAQTSYTRIQSLSLFEFL
ncbi:MAG: flagellar hook-associated protein FlgL [Pseudomonadota bacterium]